MDELLEMMEREGEIDEEFSHVFGSRLLNQAPDFFSNFIIDKKKEKSS
jgi:hypothetical protein